MISYLFKDRTYYYFFWRMNRHSSVSNDHAWKMSLLLFFIQRSNGEMDHWGNLCFLGRTRVFWVARTARCPGGGRGCIITGRTWWVSWQIIITVPHNTLLQVSCYSTARMDRVLFTEAGAEAGDPGAGPIGCGADQETETRGLDTFGGCLSSLTR